MIFHKTITSVVSISLLVNPFLVFAAVEKAEPSLMMIDPPVATAQVISIAAKGLDWGPHRDRRNPEAWLVDPDDSTLHPLTIARNYNDCGLELAMKGTCTDDQLFLRLEIPADVKGKLAAKMYGLYVKMENGMSALGQFTIVDNPLPEVVAQPTLAVEPIKGPVGTYVMLFGAGFPEEGLNVRFDGVKISAGGYFTPDEKGSFENVAITIPSTITRDGKTIAVTPGEHTIDVSNDNPTNPRSAAVKFVVQEKVESGAGKKLSKKEQDQIDADRKKQEQIDKEQQRLEQEQKKLQQEKERIEKEKADLAKKLEEEKKKEQQEKDRTKKTKFKRGWQLLQKLLNDREKIRRDREKRLADIGKKQGTLDKQEDSLKTRFCEPDMPITFQPGCVPLKKEAPKSQYEGRPCSADLPITFQPGCIGQIPSIQRSLFIGKMCSQDIPLVWQEGCIQPPRSEVKSEYDGKPCDPSKAITFQPGCISPKPKEIEMSKPITGQKCNPLIPHYSQVGCIE